MKNYFYTIIGLILLSIIMLVTCSNNKDSPVEKYIVIFDTDNPATTRQIEVSANLQIIPLPGAYRSGYDFGGWFTWKNGRGKELTVHMPITESMTVYAKWIIKDQREFSTYKYSQDMKDSGSIFAYGHHPLGFSALVALSKKELSRLREGFEALLQWGDEPGPLSWEHLSNAYEHNIRILKSVENNFPDENEINSKLSGLWRLAYDLHDAGYTEGDYLKIYNNGIFEYISRDFQATRTRYQIFGGSRFGLWTTDTMNSQKHEHGIEFLVIPGINGPVEGVEYYHFSEKITISAFDNNWQKVSDDVNYGLDWGDQLLSDFLR